MCLSGQYEKECVKLWNKEYCLIRRPTIHPFSSTYSVEGNCRAGTYPRCQEGCTLDSPPPTVGQPFMANLACDMDGLDYRGSWSTQREPTSRKNMQTPHRPRTQDHCFETTTLTIAHCATSQPMTYAWSGVLFYQPGAGALVHWC